jgi:hypothetical protein
MLPREGTIKAKPKTKAKKKRRFSFILAAADLLLSQKVDEVMTEHRSLYFKG